MKITDDTLGEVLADTPDRIKAQKESEIDDNANEN